MERVLVNLPTFPTRAPRGADFMAALVLAVWAGISRLFGRQ